MSGWGGTAFLLPGQGSQFVGMGSDLAAELTEVAELYARADELLGVPLSDICWKGPDERLTRTENAQPALLLHSYAVWCSLPRAVREGALLAAGHSLGEFTAYLVAGALSFEDALRIVRRRGELMAETRGTIQHLQENSSQQPDIADRASVETDRLIELRTRDRERKLLSKIDAALLRIDDGSYGFCVETGDPISLKRLQARPIATLGIDAQERHERLEKTYRGD